MSSELFRLAAELCRPLATPQPTPEPSRARRKAREIIDANPGATLTEIVAMAWLEGRISACQDLRSPSEYDCICQRCGRKDGSRMSATPPEHGYFETVCFACSAGDEPRAA